VTYAIPPFAIVKPFCKDGSPEGSNLRLSLKAANISCGLPIHQLTRMLYLSEKDIPPMGINVSDKRSRSMMTPT
jgi:hypothetical protein